MTDETETDTSNFAKMFDRLPAFNPPDTNSAGAIALRAWVRGLTARQRYPRRYPPYPITLTPRVWRPLRRGRRVRGPRRGVSGGVEVPFEGQAAVLRSLLKCKV